MSKMIERAKRLWLPERTTQEDLESAWSVVLNYGDKVILAGYYYQGINKPGYYGAVYEYLDDTAHDVDDPIAIRDASEGYFEDTGHAIEWAIKNANNPL